ncbi:hypothetical protein L218DRAFT_1000641 [Marasmius fiardii PR-910]|nr:hypothetical protein L218DRAFT_1000641 [Marasmius fiardii PR-910]
MSCVANYHHPHSSHRSISDETPLNLNRLAMEIFTGATGISIKKSRFSNTVIERRAKINRGLLDLSQFTEVKRGDIYKDKEVCYSWRLCSSGKDDTEAAVYTAQIMVAGHFGESKFTVKTYCGRNGKKEWQQDFLRCSTDWHGDVPLFGYNKSSVPSLIFYGGMGLFPESGRFTETLILELVPIAQVETKVRLVGQMYFEMLKNALGCSKNELWMYPAKGSFCHGPVGPKCIAWIDHDDLGVVTIPSDIEFLKEDVVIRYFSSIKHDQGLMQVLAYSTSCVVCVKNIPFTYYVQFITSLTHSTIACNWKVQWGNSKSCLCIAGKMLDGSSSQSMDAVYK